MSFVSFKDDFINGFKWEFGGMIISFNNGKLKGPAENRPVHYWLELKEDKEPKEM